MDIHGTGMSTTRRSRHLYVASDVEVMYPDVDRSHGVPRGMASRWEIDKTFEVERYRPYFSNSCDVQRTSVTNQEKREGALQRDAPRKQMLRVSDEPVTVVFCREEV